MTAAPSPLAEQLEALNAEILAQPDPEKDAKVRAVADRIQWFDEQIARVRRDIQDARWDGDGLNERIGCAALSRYADERANYAYGRYGEEAMALVRKRSGRG